MLARGIHDVVNYRYEAYIEAFLIWVDSNEILILPLEYDEAHDGVVVALKGGVRKYGENKGVDGATPGGFTVHAGAFLSIIIGLILKESCRVSRR